MNKPIHGEDINKILLKPRFKIEVNQSSDSILKKFKANLATDNCTYCSKISGNHIFLDVPEVDAHFWSPQLAIEIIENKEGKSIVKGILGPKPKVWTFFMFVHFIVAILFLVSFVVFYVKWSLGKDYQLYKWLLIGLPVLWLILYFLGQAGKKLGYQQMLALDRFLMQTLKNSN